MKATTTKLLTVSLAIAAAIAIPTAVKAEADNSTVAVTESTSSNEPFCPVPGLPWLCW